MGLKKISRLSNDFYQDYSDEKYEQILKKKTRPYSIFTVKIDNNLYAIPFKTNLTHKNGFFIKSTGRNIPNKNPGLDYKKAVILKDKKYIDENSQNIVDAKEAQYVRLHDKEIYSDFKKYILSYKKYLKHPIDAYRIALNYNNTALQYFLKNLGVLCSKQLRLDIQYSEILAYINNFLRQDGYRVNFHYNRYLTGILISDEKGKYLLYLNENNREDYCFKKTVSDKMQRGLKYPDIIKRIESIKE